MASRGRGNLEKPRRLGTGHLFLEGSPWSYYRKKPQSSGERSRKVDRGDVDGPSVKK